MAINKVGETKKAREFLKKLKTNLSRATLLLRQVCRYGSIEKKTE